MRQAIPRAVLLGRDTNKRREASSAKATGGVAMNSIARRDVAAEVAAMGRLPKMQGRDTP